MYPAGSPYASPYSTPQKQRNPLPKVEDVDDDKQSVMSRASGVPRAEHALDTLRLVAGNRVRHARCAPEFLEEIATKGVQDSLKKSSYRKFKIVNGSEAKTYFKNYIRDHHKESEQTSRNNNDKITKEIMPSPIVFAVTAWETGIKCVDYYMTWRAQPKALHGKEFERRVALLDSEFRRLARGLDNEYKRISPLRTFGNLAQPHRNLKATSHSSRSSHKPSLFATPEEPLQAANQTSLPEPPVSASDSVMSLPLLNMVRNVPFSHRVPLRVANPDRLSLISEVDISPEAELKGGISLTIPCTKPEVPASHHLSVPGIPQSSSASIRSADTTSSKSSKSSQSSSRSANHEKRDNGSHDESRYKDYEIPEYLIILLGDKLETESNSWHGLERQTSIRSLPADRHSPWIGLVAHSENAGHRSSPACTPNASDSEESDDEVGWKNTPVIPMKPFMEAMGLFPKSAYYSPPVVPGGLQYQLSVANATSPAPSQSPYLYGSPRLDPSAYMPGWLPPIQIPPNAPSRPVSRAYSSASYASPYMQTLAGPF